MKKRDRPICDWIPRKDRESIWGGTQQSYPANLETVRYWERLTTDDADLKMPPAGKGTPLTDDEIDLVRQWIEQGARYAKHWSYEKPVRPELPEVSDVQWPHNPVDHFTLAELDARGLTPSPQAARYALARRASIDLTGLPPTWQEATAFVTDEVDGAYERYIDSLLDKPAFGERWARVWLDLARYAG